MVEPSWNIHHTYPTSSNCQDFQNISEVLKSKVCELSGFADRDIGDRQNTLGDGLG